MAAKTILIKKYENRRLYDATESRYVNLDDVAHILQRGDEVRVIDVATGEDITRLILTQIVAEGAKTRDSSFPLEILRDMIVASGRASQESALRYTKAMLELYKSTYQAMSPAFNPFEFLHTAGKQESAPPPGPVPPENENGATGGEVNSLKKRVAELEKLVASLGAPRKGPRARAGKARSVSKSPRRRPSQ